MAAASAAVGATAAAAEATAVDADATAVATNGTAADATAAGEDEGQGHAQADDSPTYGPNLPVPYAEYRHFSLLVKQCNVTSAMCEHATQIHSEATREVSLLAQQHAMWVQRAKQATENVHETRKRLKQEEKDIRAIEARFD